MLRFVARVLIARQHDFSQGAEMEYRGKLYSVILSIGGKWKWSIELDGHTKSGNAANRLAGVKLAEREIDRALAPKKKRLVPPGS
jgi:hypothetical protein